MKNGLLGLCGMLLVACSGGGDSGSPIGASDNPSVASDNPSVIIEKLSGQLGVEPHETYVLLDWPPPQRDISEVRIEVRQDGQVMREVIGVENTMTTEWRIDNLVEGEAYEFRVVFIFADGIGYLGSGEDEIRTGSNMDNDLFIDSEDSDRDGDGMRNDLDDLPDDPTETVDTDGDGTGNNADLDDDGDGFRDDAVQEQMRSRRGESCSMLKDCDGDGVEDGRDLDIDGDHLIEIQTQRELDAIRFVLNGTGRRFSDTEQINTSGCSRCRGYELLNDIVLSISDPAGWDPIGGNLTIKENRGLNVTGKTIIGTFGPSSTSQVYCEGEGFSGILEGNGWTIANLTIDRYHPQERRENCIGLFGQISGEVRNLRIEANRVRGFSTVGVLAGSGRGARVIATHVGRYIDASNPEDIDGFDMFGNATMGALMGSMHYGSIVDSTAQTDVMESNAFQTGGLVGATVETTIQNSAALNGRINSGLSRKTFISDNHRTGGLIGWCHQTRINHSFAISERIEAVGNITDQMIGGLAGFCSDRIENSYALTGNITGREQIGGLIGQDGNSNTDIHDSFAMTEKIDIGSTRAVGGLIGFLTTSQGNFHSLYAITGTIIGGLSVGGLLGDFVGGRLSSSYALTGTIRGQKEVGGLIGEISDRTIPGIDSSYAVTHTLQANEKAGGLVGFIFKGESPMINSSYAMVANLTTGPVAVGGLVGKSQNNLSVIASYAVMDGSGMSGSLMSRNQSVNSMVASYGDNLTDSQQTDMLQGTILERNLVEDWRNVSLVGKRSVWCDSNRNGRIEPTEANTSSGIYVWDFGEIGEYPHIQCAPPVWSDFGLKADRWRTLVAGELDIPDSEELTQRIREFRGERRLAFLRKLIIPYEDAMLLRWQHPRQAGRDVTSITIEVQHNGEVVRRISVADIRLSAYRVENLVAGEGYEFEVVFTYDDGSKVRLHSDGEVFTGTNRDQDGWIDARDPDDDNDGLLDTDAREQLTNSDGISCSLLEDCDDDGTLDRDDTHPTDPSQD